MIVGRIQESVVFRCTDCKYESHSEILKGGVSLDPPEFDDIPPPAAPKMKPADAPADAAADPIEPPAVLPFTILDGGSSSAVGLDFLASIYSRLWFSAPDAAENLMLTKLFFFVKSWHLF